MKIHCKFRVPQINMVFLTPAVLIHGNDRNNAQSNFFFGISVDWLWWQLGIAFLKQKGEIK